MSLQKASSAVHTKRRFTHAHIGNNGKSLISTCTYLIAKEITMINKVNNTTLRYISFIIVIQSFLLKIFRWQKAKINKPTRVLSKFRYNVYGIAPSVIIRFEMILGLEKPGITWAIMPIEITKINNALILRANWL